MSKSTYRNILILNNRQTAIKAIADEDSRKSSINNYYKFDKNRVTELLNK